MSKATYIERKTQGICVSCGKVPSRAGKVMCVECAEKQKVYQEKTRDFCKKMGICPRCHKNKLFGEEKMCLECSAKDMFVRKKSRERKGKTDMDYYREGQKKLAQLGLCRTGCGRQRATGRTYCEICLAKHRKRTKEYARKKRNDYLPRSERPNYNLCYTCGSSLDRTGKVCTECAKTMTDNLPKTSNNEYWRKQNKIIFKKA